MDALLKLHSRRFVLLRLLSSQSLGLTCFHTTTAVISLFYNKDQIDEQSRDHSSAHIKNVIKAAIEESEFENGQAPLEDASSAGSLEEEDRDLI